jgi:uncharacterized protein YndB with AHSA1/START domain
MYHVVAQRRIAADVESVWSFLTRPELLARWFADTPRFAPGGSFRFEFGDGDFFAGRVIDWEPNIQLGVSWRFVELGPSYEVRFSLLRRHGGTEVSITDRGSLTEDEALCLRVGWSEFLMRLEKAIAQGNSQRFEWRKEITFTAIVTGCRGAALEALGDPSWYRDHLAGARASPRAPGRGDDVAMTVADEAWGDAETVVRAKARRIKGVDYAFIAHEGWRGVPPPEAAVERRRYAGLWFEALGRFEAAAHDGARIP